MHCYNVNDWQDSMTFQAKAVKDGMLEFVGEKETMAGSLFRRTNKVMNVEKTGGIDLTPAHMNLQTKVDSRLRGNDNIAGGNDKGIVFHLDPAMLAQLQNAPGFVPVIISIQPMNDLRKFLGVASS